MKRLSLALVFVCLTLAAFAQSSIKVNYKGAKPTVVDFAMAAFTDFNADDGEPGDRPWRGVEQALTRYRKGFPQEKGVKLTVDLKNGYILYEQDYDEDDYFCRMEICYWNESDGKHKLVAFNNTETFAEGCPVSTETHGLTFFRYNNATKRMVWTDAPGFRVEYLGTTYAMPRQGKDIVVTKWDDNGKPSRKTLKWNGKRFSY